MDPITEQLERLINAELDRLEHRFARAHTYGELLSLAVDTKHFADVFLQALGRTEALVRAQSERARSIFAERGQKS